MNNLNVSVSPHIKSPITTQKIMMDVLIALAPVTIASFVLFGIRAVLLVCVCVTGSILCEFLSQKVMKRKVTVSDCSAAVTGLLLALSLPAKTTSSLQLMASYAFWIGSVHQRFSPTISSFMSFWLRCLNLSNAVNSLAKFFLGCKEPTNMKYG